MWNSFTDKIIVNDKFNFRRNRRKSGLMACSTTANTKVSMGGGGGGRRGIAFNFLRISRFQFPSLLTYMRNKEMSLVEIKFFFTSRRVFCVS